jgi:SAM-dependent methyltransferase
VTAALSNATPLSRAEVEEASLSALQRTLASNRFLPFPPPGMHDVGDGDFRAIGAEFLGHFVRYGELRPTEAVLDIGCGLGRMAIPLTQYLQAPQGRYHGVDIVASAIAWNTDAITSVYPNFTFAHLDAQNDLYNPGGTVAPDKIALPVAAESVDLAVMTSVFTHLDRAAADAYLREVRRVLRPGGRLLATLFLIDDATRAALGATENRLRFDLDKGGPHYIADPEHPLAAVAFDRDYFLGRAAAAGLAPRRPIVPGFWSGRASGVYQDLAVLQPKPGARP